VRTARHKILACCARVGTLDEGMRLELDAFEFAEAAAELRLAAIAAPYREGRPVTMSGTCETSNRARMVVS
jgi:hypothetical protein